MAGKKRRKRRAHRARHPMAAPRAARQRQAAPAGSRPATLGGAPCGDAVAEARKPGPEPVNAGRDSIRVFPPAAPTFGRLGGMATALLPGRVFFAIGRPALGVVCCVLQATLLGWLPAAVWAFQAKQRVAAKQRGLAARLRPL